MITYQENEALASTVLLADNTPVTVKVYDVYENEVKIAEGLMESQLDTGGNDVYCWQITDPYAMAQDNALQYLQPNAANQNALPKPKNSPNPGGSPVKY